MQDLSLNALDAFANCALDLAQEGGSVLKEYFGNLHHVRDKALAGDLVTEADQESERRILSLLKNRYPQHAVLAEESGSHEGIDSEFLWVIDPLDGTVNYAHQYPLVCVSVALVYRGQPIVAVVYNPIQNEIFSIDSRSRGNIKSKAYACFFDAAY